MAEEETLGKEEWITEHEIAEWLASVVRDDGQPLAGRLRAAKQAQDMGLYVKAADDRVAIPPIILVPDSNVLEAPND